MATNAGPVYGKQYIRYAETFEAPATTPAGEVEIGEFRLVRYFTTPGTACTDAQAGGTIPEKLGVNQAYMPSAVAEPATARQLTVARSGLLLVELATGSADFAPGDALQSKNTGEAEKGGDPVTVNGTTPIVREQIEIGGRKMVLVSFA